MKRTMEGAVTAMYAAPEGLHRIKIYREDDDGGPYADIEPVHMFVAVHYASDDGGRGRSEIHALSWSALATGLTDGFDPTNTDLRAEEIKPSRDEAEQFARDSLEMYGGDLSRLRSEEDGVSLLMMTPSRSSSVS